MVDGVMNYLQWATLGHLGKELQRLELDYITRPIAYQANEYHIYKCLDLVEARSLRFEEAKEEVRKNSITRKI